MFVYASFYGMIKKQEQKSNKTAFIRVHKIPSSLDEVFAHLSVPQKIVADSWFKENSQRLKTLGEKRRCCSYDGSWLDEMSCDGKHFVIGGYRTNYKYFQDVAESIKDEFVFKQEIREKAQKRFYSILKQHGVSRKRCTLVGAHMRRGDFATPDKHEFGHSAAKVEYLVDAVRLYENIYYFENWSNDALNSTDTAKIDLAMNAFKKVGNDCLVFLIIGNDHDWNLKATKKIELLMPRRTKVIAIDQKGFDAATDMSIMKLCDNMIISAGTYSFWCGFFSPGMVTYQKEYARYGSSHFKEYEPETYFPRHWIAL